jgi:hypothetical protein
VEAVPKFGSFRLHAGSNASYLQAAIPENIWSLQAIAHGISGVVFEISAIATVALGKIESTPVDMEGAEYGPQNQNSNSRAVTPTQALSSALTPRA